MDIGTLIGMFFAGLGIAVAVVSTLVCSWLMVPLAFNRSTGFRQVFQSELGPLRPLVYDDETLTRLPLLMLPFFRSWKRHELGISYQPKWKSADVPRGAPLVQALRDMGAVAPPSDLPPHLVAFLFDPHGWKKAQLAQLVSLAQRDELQVRERVSAYSTLLQVEASMPAGTYSENASLFKSGDNSEPVYWNSEKLLGRHHLELELIGFPSKWRAGLYLGAVGTFLIVGAVAVKPAYLPFLIVALGIAWLTLALISVQRIFPQWHIERMRWLEFRNYLRKFSCPKDSKEAGELFAKYLPYAIALGVISEWIQHFADVPIQKPRWWEWGWVDMTGAEYLPQRREVSRRLGWALNAILEVPWETLQRSSTCGPPRDIVPSPAITIKQWQQDVLESLSTPRRIVWEAQIGLVESYEKRVRSKVKDPDVQAEAFFELGQQCEGFLLSEDLALSYYLLAYQSMPQPQALARALDLNLAVGNLDSIIELLAIGISDLFYPEKRNQVYAHAGDIGLDAELRDRAHSRLRELKNADPRWPFEPDEIDALSAVEYSREGWQATAEQLSDRARAEQGTAPSKAAQLWFQAARIFDAKDRLDPRYEECLRAVVELQPQHRLGNMLLENWLAEQRRFDEIESFHNKRLDSLEDKQQRLYLLKRCGSMWLLRWKDRARACRFYARALDIVYRGSEEARNVFPGHVRAFCLLREELGPKGEGASVMTLAELARSARMSHYECGALMAQASLTASEDMKDAVRAKLFLKEARWRVPNPDD